VIKGTKLAVIVHHVLIVYKCIFCIHCYVFVAVMIYMFCEP